MPVHKRGKYAIKIRDFVYANADRISKIISDSTGKTRIEALSTEVLPSAMAANYYAKNAENFLKKQKIKGSSILFFNKKSTIYRVPFGVIGIISPWNYPFSTPFYEVVMGLICGNAVILKVATQTQPVGDVIEEAVRSSGLPAGVFSLMHLPGSVAGKAFVEERMDKIFFTGSTLVGKELMALSAAKLIPLCLELGGKDAMVVLKDANLVRASKGAVWAGISNAGQSCAGVERIYVEEPVYDKFTNLLRNEVASLSQGHDDDFSVDFGALTLSEQLNTVKKQVDDALARGASITASSKKMAENGNERKLFYPALILENVTDEMLVMKEETFGPILAVIKVKNFDEALKKANDSIYGLTSSVWTNNRKLAYQAAGVLQSGTVSLNDHLMSHGLAETPWGGFKESGFGRSHGKIGFEEMTQVKVVVEELLSFMPKNMWWQPYNKKVYEGLKGILDFLYGRNIFTKITGLFKLTKTFLRSFRRGL